MTEIEKDFPEVIYFYKKEGSNGISCLDYKNDSDIKFIRFDIHSYQMEQLKEQLAQKDKENEEELSELNEYYLSKGRHLIKLYKEQKQAVERLTKELRETKRKTK